MKTPLNFNFCSNHKNGQHNDLIEVRQGQMRSHLECLLEFLGHARKIPDGKSLLTKSLDVPLNRRHIRGSREGLVSTVHVKDHKIQAHLASVVENNLSDCCLIKQLNRE